MMRTIIFVFISVILESRGYGKIVGDCSPQVDMPCTLHKLTGNDCLPVNLRTEFSFFETSTAKFPGKPGSLDAVGSYRMHPNNNWYPEVNLTFTTPQNAGKNYVKGFEVIRYAASNNNRPTCYILDLSNVTWDENSVADMHTKFRLDLYPLYQTDPRYFAFEVYALPKQQNMDDKFDQYLQTFIQFPGFIPVNESSPRNWLATIDFTQDSNLGTINVTIEQPPAEYSFTLFEYILVHSGSIVPFILEKSKNTWYQFTKVPTGVYQIWVKPAKDEDHCPCKDVTGLVCDHCTNTMTKNFSFNYTGPPFPRTTSRQVEIVNPVNTITTTGLTSKTSGGGTTTESMERLSTQSPEASKAQVAVAAVDSPTIDLIAIKTYTTGQGALTLRCTADSNPAPDYVWLLPDGSESIGSHLELTNLTVGNSGFYICIAHNVFKGENHTTNTTTYIRVEKAPTPSTEVTTTTPSLIQTTSGEAYYSLKGAIHVVCTNYHWNITVEMDKIRHIYPTARASDIYLGENKCKGVQNGDLLVFQHDLSKCLTSELLVNGIEVYNNELIYAEHDPVYLFIVLHYNWTVGVECDIGQNGTAIGGFSSNATSAIAHNISSPQYPVSVSFYKDQDFIHEIGKGNPLHAQIGSHVYAKVFTTVTDWNIRMRVHTCYTKPTEQVHDHMKYFLIKDGCEVNTNTHIISQSTHETRFVFDSFEYSNSHDGIYVFCDALFCDSSDWSAQCRQTCNPVT